MIYALISALVLGTFSKLQKVGLQGSLQSRFALCGSMARIILPIAAGYTEEAFESSGSFAIVLIMLGTSMIGVAVNHKKILYYVSDVGDKNGQMEFENVGICMFGMLCIIIAMLNLFA